MLLTAEEIRYSPPGHAGASPVLDGVSLDIEAGEMIDIVGPSGSGKTTLLRALARLLPNVTGRLTLSGGRAEDITPAEWRRHVMLLPQKPVTFGGTVGENLTLPWRLKVRAQQTQPTPQELRDALDSVGLVDIELDRDAARLSVGQAARVALLRATLTCADVLLLDEPDASLDDVSAEQVRALTARYVAAGGAAVRVRHTRHDALATRRCRLIGGHLGDLDPLGGDPDA